MSMDWPGTFAPAEGESANEDVGEDIEALVKVLSKLVTVFGW